MQHQVGDALSIDCVRYEPLLSHSAELEQVRKLQNQLEKAYDAFPPRQPLDKSTDRNAEGSDTCRGRRASSKTGFAAVATTLPVGRRTRVSGTGTHVHLGGQVFAQNLHEGIHLDSEAIVAAGERKRTGAKLFHVEPPGEIIDNEARKPLSSKEPF